MKKPCGVEGCDNDFVARGMCMTHYMQWRRHVAPRPQCAWEGCDKNAVAVGFCDHHRALQRGGVT